MWLVSKLKEKTLYSFITYKLSAIEPCARKPADADKEIERADRLLSPNNHAYKHLLDHWFPMLK